MNSNRTFPTLMHIRLYMQELLEDFAGDDNDFLHDEIDYLVEQLEQAEVQIMYCEDLCKKIDYTIGMAEVEANNNEYEYEEVA